MLPVRCLPAGVGEAKLGRIFIAVRAAVRWKGKHNTVRQAALRFSFSYVRVPPTRIVRPWAATRRRYNNYYTTSLARAPRKASVYPIVDRTRLTHLRHAVSRQSIDSDWGAAYTGHSPDMCDDYTQKPQGERSYRGGKWRERR